MNMYKIYVLKDSELKLFDVAFTGTAASKVLDGEENKYKFFVVQSFLLDDKHLDNHELVSSYIYLGMVKLKRFKREVTVEDIEELKPALTKIYRVDGTIDYFPDMPMSVQDVQNITGGWFSGKIVQDEPSRYAIMFFDTKQYGINKMPEYNKRASKEFGVDLYGDVLFTKECFIA